MQGRKVAGLVGDLAPVEAAFALKALVEAGANLQLADRSGQTPLSLAKARGYSAMVVMLEKAGAR